MLLEGAAEFYACLSLQRREDGFFESSLVIQGHKLKISEIK